MDMVERVARAMREAIDGDRTRYCYINMSADLDNTLVDGEVDFLDLARVAISAMREPTDLMAQRAAAVADGYRTIGEFESVAMWQAMLDTACPPSPVERG